MRTRRCQFAAVAAAAAQHVIECNLEFLIQWTWQWHSYNMNGIAMGPWEQWLISLIIDDRLTCGVWVATLWLKDLTCDAQSHLSSQCQRSYSNIRALPSQSHSSQCHMSGSHVLSGSHVAFAFQRFWPLNVPAIGCAGFLGARGPRAGGSPGARGAAIAVVGPVNRAVSCQGLCQASVADFRIWYCFSIAGPYFYNSCLNRQGMCHCVFNIWIEQPSLLSKVNRQECFMIGSLHWLNWPSHLHQTQESPLEAQSNRLGCQLLLGLYLAAPCHQSGVLYILSFPRVFYFAVAVPVPPSW